MRLKKSHGLPLIWDLPVLSYHATSFQCGFKPGDKPQRIERTPGRYLALYDVEMTLALLAIFDVYAKAYPNFVVDISAPITLAFLSELMVSLLCHRCLRELALSFPTRTTATTTITTRIMLCGVCERVLERYENEYPSEVCDKFFGHHRNSAAIHSAAVLGCYMCSKIWRTLSVIPLPLSEAEFFQKEDVRVRQEESTPRMKDNDQIATDEFYTYAQLLRGTWRDYDGDRPDDFRLWFQVGLEDGPNGYLGVGSFYLERLSGMSSYADNRVQL